MLFRSVSGVMAVLFALAVAVQYNDPDPALWVAIYGAACALSIATALRGRAPFWTTCAVGLIALAWATGVALGVTGITVYTHMFDAWEMKSTQVEEARETTGLLMVAIWMAVTAGYARRTSRR